MNRSMVSVTRNMYTLCDTCCTWLHFSDRPTSIFKQPKAYQPNTGNGERGRAPMCFFCKVVTNGMSQLFFVTLSLNNWDWIQNTAVPDTPNTVCSRIVMCLVTDRIEGCGQIEAYKQCDFLCCQPQCAWTLSRTSSSAVSVEYARL